MLQSQYILLPKIGVRAQLGTKAQRALLELPFAQSTGDPKSAIITIAGSPEVNIIDSISEDGPKLAEMDVNSAAIINQPDSPLRAVPLVKYNNPTPSFGMELSATTATAISTITIRCTDQNTGVPIPDARVIAITDLVNRIGAAGTTDTNGDVSLSLSGNTIENLYVIPDTGIGEHFAGMNQ